jgi:hypothetical protein
MKKIQKEEKEKKSKKIYSKTECVCLGFHSFIYLWMCFFFDKIAKNKEDLIF